MDEEYVQEHISTDGIVAPLEAPRRLIHGRLQPFRSALSRRTRHISSGLAVFVLLLRVAAAPMRRSPNDLHVPQKPNRAGRAFVNGASRPPRI
jgi:hypothetical protein